MTLLIQLTKKALFDPKLEPECIHTVEVVSENINPKLSPENVAMRTNAVEVTFNSDSNAEVNMEREREEVEYRDASASINLAL